MYDTTIRDYMKYDFAENVGELEVSEPLHFMLHLKEERETMKVCIIFDALWCAAGKIFFYLHASSRIRFKPKRTRHPPLFRNAIDSNHF